MSEWWVAMGIIASFLGLLILLIWLFDQAWKETIREVRDIWHEDDEDKNESAGERRRRQGRS